MPRLPLNTTTPLYLVAGLCVAAAATIVPEPLAGGWWQATAAGAALAGLASVPVWRAAAAEERQRGHSAGAGVVFAVLAAMFVGATLAHVANAAGPPTPEQRALLPVTDKYRSRWRVGRSHAQVITAPVPGMAAASGHHDVGIHLPGMGDYDDYQVGACLALRWRQGRWWPIVVGRAAAPCPAAALPLARPGQAWGLVQQRLAAGLDRLDLPAGGLRIDLAVQIDTNGTIIATAPLHPGTAAPDSVTALIAEATGRVPFALAGPPGRYRLWLKLVPNDKGGAEGRI